MTCAILDDGTLSFTDKSGAHVPEHVVEAAKKQNRDAILSLIQSKCDEINEQIEVLGKLHHDTPDSNSRPNFIAKDFPDPRPTAPAARLASLLDRLVPGRGQKISAANRDSEARFLKELADWEVRKKRFDSETSERKHLLESLIYTDVGAMEQFLQENLEDIGWPRETTVAFEVNDGGKTVALSVDLPEVEDMPSKLAAVPARGLKLSVKELGVTKVQKLYAEHIHGVVFRLVGEVFAALPNVQEVTAAGYSQRRNPSTAQLQDDYLLSVRVARSTWNRMDFAHLSSLNVPEALSQFDLRREMSKSGVLKAITPHADSN